ncbi:hypothetical protein QBC35DRAFT_40204 [Podospora australis]|uniref:Hemicentin-1-like von Willebrand factor A domain-containing protein n=1 Tax=Podospora australis TaxID=1536484 RepID=A0AAN6WMW7_9PEZI|nr:hypothetical protein QBC35DRAFT_40204 [Podospora australis]
MLMQCFMLQLVPGHPSGLSSGASSRVLTPSSSPSPSLVSRQSVADFTTPKTPDQTLSKLHDKESSASDQVASSRTRERVRRLEEENETLRRVAMENLMVMMRLKHEMEAGPTTVDAELGILKLKYDMLKAKNSHPPSTLRSTIFKDACSADVIFLMDTTGSTIPYIQAAKDQVRMIVEGIKKTFFKECDVRIAIVSYKDHADYPNVEVLKFTPNIENVHRFLDTLNARGGQDTPEDVLGGINVALQADWKHETRCIFHIADAPPHD